MVKNKIFGIKRNIFFSLITWIVVIVILYLTVSLKSGSIGIKECPNKIEGNVNAPLLIKYFESPFCLYCWIEEPILKDLLNRRGDLFALERYDVRYCRNETAKYEISGTPSFVFSLKNETKEYAHYGFIEKENLERIICGATGGC